jgi:hypothetical protein
MDVSSEVERHILGGSSLGTGGLSSVFEVMPHLTIDHEHPPPVAADITFEATTTGYEIHYNERIATEHPELVDECAVWMDGDLGVLNLGQIDHNILLADGPLTDEVKQGVIDWWRARIEVDFG